ncbi:uncharacterized serine-rich protein C215.13-like [Hyalella azteca]|uniref:Uncharacterized serine-rich protein C215.13-like n=1 Tax=Hyalella azteca TaxID=294128 RepID=A0A979FJ71_HYAAZ|nr:uncharacterized serine-rich protein C215.13-like [Hyalella azteca]
MGSSTQPLLPKDFSSSVSITTLFTHSFSNSSLTDSACITSALTHPTVPNALRLCSTLATSYLPSASAVTSGYSSATGTPTTVSSSVFVSSSPTSKVSIPNGWLGYYAANLSPLIQRVSRFITNLQISYASWVFSSSGLSDVAAPSFSSPSSRLFHSHPSSHARSTRHHGSSGSSRSSKTRNSPTPASPLVTSPDPAPFYAWVTIQDLYSEDVMHFLNARIFASQKPRSRIFYCIRSACKYFTSPSSFPPARSAATN